MARGLQESAIEITTIIKIIGDIREEIELCNRYYLLHDFPQFGTWGLFFAYIYSIAIYSKVPDFDRHILAIEIATAIKIIGDIKEEIELCNRYYLLHDFPQFGTWGLFFAYIYSIAILSPTHACQRSAFRVKM